MLEQQTDRTKYIMLEHKTQTKITINTMTECQNDRQRIMDRMLEHQNNRQIERQTDRTTDKTSEQQTDKQKDKQHVRMTEGQNNIERQNNSH